MPEATNQQVQSFCDTRIRPRAEQFRTIIAALRDDQAVIADVYQNANDAASTFADNRTDGPPHLLQKSDVLVFNAISVLLLKVIDGTAVTADVQQIAANWPVFMQACVRGV
jgi:hypothetical protein